MFILATEPTKEGGEFNDDESVELREVRDE